MYILYILRVESRSTVVYMYIPSMYYRAFITEFQKKKTFFPHFKGNSRAFWFEKKADSEREKKAARCSTWHGINCYF